MKSETDKEDHFIKAEQKVRKLWWFYIHLVGYFVVVALILLNFYVIEEGPYKNNIISLNLSVLVAWTVIIIIHGVKIFKGKQIFKKSWEDKKIDGFLKEETEEETTFWE